MYVDTILFRVLNETAAQTSSVGWSALIEKALWPAVILVIFYYLKEPLIRLLSSLKTIKGYGILMESHQQESAIGIKKGFPETAMDTSLPKEGPAVLQVEQSIRDDPAYQRSNSPADREALLVRALAKTRIIAYFEIIYPSIFLSQVQALRYLSESDRSVEFTELESYYKNAVQAYPETYKNYPFNGWISYLSNNLLVSVDEETVTITPLGEEFLKYLVLARKPGPNFN